MPGKNPVLTKPCGRGTMPFGPRSHTMVTTNAAPDKVPMASSVFHFFAFFLISAKLKDLLRCNGGGATKVSSCWVMLGPAAWSPSPNDLLLGGNASDSSPDSCHPTSF